MNNKIPLAYQIIVTRLHEHSINNELAPKKVKNVMRFFCRIPKNFVRPIVKEMCDMKLISVNGWGKIKILREFPCDLLKRHPGRYKL